MAIDEEREGLNRLELSVAAIHSLALASISAVVVFKFFGEPSLSMVVSAFLGWFTVLLAVALQRSPRLRLRPLACATVVISGVVTGFTVCVIYTMMLADGVRF